VFGSSGDANAAANDKEVVAVMCSATWDVTENEKRLASMATAQSKTVSHFMHPHFLEYACKTNPQWCSCYMKCVEL
jgi:hypothetical protein